MVIRGQLLAFKHTDETSAWQHAGSQPNWNVYDRNTLAWSGPFDTLRLRTHLGNYTEEYWSQLVLLPSGMEEMGFFMRDVRDLLSLIPQSKNSTEQTTITLPNDESEAINSEYGEFTCPICWWTPSSSSR